MGIEGDFPITRTQAQVLVIGLVVMMGLGFALFGGLIPGVSPRSNAPSNLVFVNGQAYATEALTLATPSVFQNSTLSQAFLFQNVTFSFWTSDWYSVDGAELHGNGTEGNGASYAFTLGPTGVPWGNSTSYFSPDHLFGVVWVGGPLVGNSVRVMVHD